MNTAIEHLNQWGGQFLSLAGAMFWQSSVLGLALLLLDFGLRRHLRASVRYGLWLVFLVKLVTPPSLALPTSPAWWWSSATRAALTAPHDQTPAYTVTESELPPSETPPPGPPPFTAPPPGLTRAALVMLAMSGVSAGLFLWLLLRWRKVALAERAANEVAAFLPLQAEARRLGNLRSGVPVKVTPDTISPAVCGLFRPVILLPQALTEKLSPAQLRAVLLHELLHLRRGDVWVNFAQALIQIIYWWHPLVWLANARIGRLREEAVDDAVMVALREDAEIYAPTLLAVARFALQRPPASLGLVGILESRSALRERIERLVNFPAPRKAGLGFLSVFGILVFSAVALPMGDAPEPAPAPTPLEATADNPANPPVTVDASTSAVPFNPYAVTGLVYTGPGRREIAWKLDHMHLDNVAYAGLPLSEVLSNLTAQVRRLDPQGTGVNFVINPNPDLSDNGASEALNANSVLVNLKLSNVSVGDVLDAIVLVADHPIKYSIQDFGVVFSARPVQIEALSMRTFKVDPSAFGQGLEGVGSTTFGAGGVSAGAGGGAGNNGGSVVPVVNMAPVVSQRPQGQSVGSAGGDASGQNGGRNSPAIKRKTDAMSIRFQEFFHGMGVDLRPPKALFYNDGLGLLFVKATESDLDKIERALRTLNARQSPSPFKPMYLAPPTNGGFLTNSQQNSAPTAAQITGILSNPNFQAAMHALEQQQGITNLAEPQQTTSGGRGENRITVTVGDLLAAAKLLYETGWWNEAEQKLRQVLALDSGNTDAQYYLDLIKKARSTGAASPAQPSPSGTRLETLQLTVESGLPKFRAQTGLTAASGVDEYLAAFSHLLAQSGATLPANSVWLGARELLLVEGTPAELAAVERLFESLNATPARTVRPSARDHAPPAAAPNLNPADAPAADNAKLSLRTFKLNARAFPANLAKTLGQSDSAISAATFTGLRQLCERMGVSLEAPKSLFYNDRLGLLFVKATSHDLDIIEQIIAALNTADPQLHIKARFIEYSGNLKNIPALTNFVEGQTAIGLMTAGETAAFLRTAQSDPGFATLAEPEATTISGRQTKMLSTQLATVLTGINPRALTPPGLSSVEVTNLSRFNPTNLAFGPIFAVVPWLLSDGSTINLTVKARADEFDGYDQPTQAVDYYVAGRLQSDQVPVPKPHIIERQFRAHVNLWDGQTLVLSNPIDPRTGQPVEIAGRHQKHLLVLATVSVVDSAGNLAHTAAEMSFARDQTPPQPPPPVWIDRDVVF
jgi:beta-lactamase regulating signal transducer with metallopeptidase domain